MKNSSINNIAIVDDHNFVRSAMINHIHANTNLKVIIDACNGREFINKIVINETKPMICLIDISMPVLNGYNTICELRKLYPEMKFLVLTAIEHEFSIIKMIRNGAHGYLLKSCSIKEIENAVHDILEKGYYFSELVTEKLMMRATKAKSSEFLTNREIQFLSLCCSDLTYNLIAQEMHVSVRTLQDYQEVLKKKLNISTRLGLALFAVATGIVHLNKT